MLTDEQEEAVREVLLDAMMRRQSMIPSDITTLDLASKVVEMLPDLEDLNKTKDIVDELADRIDWLLVGRVT